MFLFVYSIITLGMTSELYLINSTNWRFSLCVLNCLYSNFTFMVYVLFQQKRCGVQSSSTQ